MLVSSKHLSLASPVFRKLLNSKLLEGEALRINKCLDLALPEDDVYAFSLIMKIVHLRNNSLPSTVSLSTLTSLAVLVDKYEFHESVTAWAGPWAAKVSKAPLHYRNEFAYWICVCWVFGLSDKFAKITAGASKQLRSTGIYGGLGAERLSNILPIPLSITSK